MKNQSERQHFAAYNQENDYPETAHLPKNAKEKISLAMCG